MSQLFLLFIMNRLDPQSVRSWSALVLITISQYHNLSFIVTFVLSFVLSFYLSSFSSLFSPL